MKKLQQKIKDQINDPNKKEIISKSSGYLVFRVIGILGGYLFTYTIAKTYGASLNGLVTLSFAIFMFASTFGSLGIDVNLVKYYSSFERWKTDPGLFFRVFSKSLIFSCFLTVLLFLSKDLIVLNLFKKPQLMPIYNWAIFAIPGWTMIKNFAGVLRAKGLNNWFSFFNNTSRFSLAFLLLISFNFIELDITNAIKAHFYAIYVLALVAFIVVLKNFKRISFVSETNSWQFLREAFPMFMSSSIIVFLGWLDSFVLGIYVEDSAIGVYSVAIKLAMICSFSMEAINSGLAPKVANLYREGKHKEFKKLIHFVTLLNFGITVLIVVGIIIANKWLLGLFGEEFKSGTTVLLILCCIHLISSAMGSAAIIMQMTGYQKQYRNIALVSLGLNLTLNFILIPNFGIIGAAIATAFSLSFWNISNAVFLKRKENIVTYFSPFKKFKR